MRRARARPGVRRSLCRYNGRVYVRRLELANFRCYRQLDLALPLGTVVVTGANAQGKSSLLEALYLLATTRSPYAAPDREWIHWAALEEPLPFSRVAGEVVRSAGTDRLEVVQLRQAGDHGEERYTKQVRLNGSPRRAMDLLGRLNVVLFTPRDLDLVAGGPAERRRYLDVLLCQVDGAYCRALARFNRALVQRNHLLRRLRDRGGDRAELVFWDERLAEDGGLVLARRWGAVTRLSRLANAVHAELVGASAPLVASYAGTIPCGGDAADPQVMAEHFQSRLAARREDDVTRGMTMIGPHRDDVRLAVDGVDMRSFGSRGQQRTVTVALKLAEAQLMADVAGEAPVLLLDDVLSELDNRRQAYLIERVDGRHQTLLTATDPENPALARLPDALRLHVAGAAIRAAGA